MMMVAVVSGMSEIRLRKYGSNGAESQEMVLTRRLMVTDSRAVQSPRLRSFQSRVESEKKVSTVLYYIAVCRTSD